MSSLDTLVTKAVREIRECVSRYGPFYIMFSGGKDSLACLDLYLKAVGKEMVRAVVFVEMTGNTMAEAVDYVYRVARHLGVEDKLVHLKLPYDMLEKVKQWGIPTPRRLWCYGEKYRMFRKHLEPPYNWVIGIKASDSARRASPKWNRYVVILPEKKEVALQPIIEWSNEHVFRYIERENLPLNPCYEKYGFGGVCVFCPFRDERAITKIMADPLWRQKIVDALASLKSTRSKFVDGVVKRWLRRARSQRTIEEWLKSSRG